MLTETSSSNSNNKTILLIGCEPALAQELVHCLKQKNFLVLVLVASAEAATSETKVLQQIGAQVVLGSLSNAEHLVQAMQGVYGVVHAAPRMIENTNILLSNNEKEETMGRKVGEAAMFQQVQHYIYLSTAACDSPVALQSIEVKCKLGTFFKSLGLPLTVVRMVSIMEDLLDIIMQQKFNTLSNILGHVEIQLICWRDVARFVTMVLENANQYLHKTVSIASDTLDKKDIKAVYEKVTGEKLDKLAVPLRGFRNCSSPAESSDQEDALLERFKMFNLTGYHANVADCGKACTGMQTWQDFVTQHVVKPV